MIMIQNINLPQRVEVRLLQVDAYKRRLNNLLPLPLKTNPPMIGGGHQKSTDCRRSLRIAKLLRSEQSISEPL